MRQSHRWHSISLILAAIVVFAVEPASAQQGGNLLTAGQQVAPQPSTPPQQVRPRTAALIGLIQETVEPECWVLTTSATVGTGPIDPSGLQLIDVIQTHIYAATWDINGGFGTIKAIPW